MLSFYVLMNSIKEQLSLNEVHGIVWTRTSYQLADCLTKKTAPSDTLLHVLKAGDFKLDLETHFIDKQCLINTN